MYISITKKASFQILQCIFKRTIKIFRFVIDFVIKKIYTCTSKNILLQYKGKWKEAKDIMGFLSKIFKPYSEREVAKLILNEI